MTNRFSKHNRYLLPLIVFLLMAINNFALAEQPPVVVKTYDQHIGSNIVYTYRVTNLGPNRLFSFSIGCNCLNWEDPQVSGSGPQLIVYPIDYVFQAKNCGETSLICGHTSTSSFSAPTNWYGSVEHYERRDYISFKFSAK